MALKGVDSVTGTARQSDDDEAQDGEGYKRNNDVGADISKESGDSADDENQSSTTEFDPLAEAVVKLQAALDALDNEVQLVKEIRDELQGPVDEEVHEASSSTTFALRDNTDISLHNLKKHVNTLKQDVDISKMKLEEAKAVLEAKETNVTKLEGEEIDAEIEELFKHKIEAEFQCLVISRAVEKLKNDVVDQFPLSDEVQTTLNVIRDTQSNVSMLKKQAERLETHIEDTVETEQVITLQKRIRQVTSCLFIQLILLILVFVSFVLDLSPHNAGIVPT